MSGIFPSGGVDALNTTSAQPDPLVAALCEALYYRTNCNPRFDPRATNALISELVNAITMFGDAYDCSRLDNLKLTLQKLQGFAGLGIREVDGDDLIAGMFDGVAGLAGVGQLLRLAPNIYPTSGEVVATDMIGMSDENGAAFKASAAALKAYLSAGQEQPTGRPFGLAIGGFAPVSGNRLDVSGKNALMLRIQNQNLNNDNTPDGGVLRIEGFSISLYGSILAWIPILKFGTTWYIAAERNQAVSTFPAMTPLTTSNNWDVRQTGITGGGTFYNATVL